MDLLAATFFLGATIAWLVAAGSALAMVQHRAEGVSVVYLATHGLAFFDERHFKPEAAPHRRRFLGAFAAFFFAVIGAGIVVALTRRT